MTVKISNLPAATSAGSGDVIPIVQGGTTKKIDLANPITLFYDNTTSGLSASSVQSAIDEIESTKAETDIFSATVTATSSPSDWTATGSPPGAPYTAVLTVTGILSTDTPIIDLDMSNVSFADVPDVVGEFGLIYRVEASADGEITLYATAEPTEDFDLTIQVVR